MGKKYLARHRRVGKMAFIEVTCIFTQPYCHMLVSDNENTNIIKKESLFQLYLHSFGRILAEHRSFAEQAFLVIAAFAAMVLVSYAFISRIISDQMDIYNQSVSTGIYRQAEEIFYQLESVVLKLAKEVEDQATAGTPIDKIQEYLGIVNGQLDQVMYRRLYCVLDGHQMDVTDWYSGGRHNPQERPWDVTIEERNGELVYMTFPNDQREGHFIICLGKALYITKNGERQCIGVLSIDIEIPQIVNLVNNILHLLGGYAVLINPQHEIVAHNHLELYGTPISEAGEGGALLAKEIKKTTGTISDHFTAVNVDGNLCVYYYGKLKNGWVVVSATPVAKYYHQTRLAGITLVVFGTIMAAILCFFLSKLHHEKTRADMRSQSKSTFLARMSHEIRTPMNVISGLSRLIAQDKGEIPPKIFKYAVEIRHAADNLLAIINDVLDISKIEAGKLEIVKVSFTLSMLLNDIINIIHTRIFDKGLQFISFVDPRLPNNLIGDIVHFRQILLNILGNAAKYTREGHVAFDVLGTKTDEKTLMLSFIVRDTGIGIKPENLSKIFTDFVQLDMQHNWNIESTGLGLSISKKLVDSLNGSISITSQYGQGTTFTINLPVEIENDSPCASIRNADVHNILIYEPRAVYEQSLLRTLNLLDVPYKRIQSISGFHETLQNDSSITLIFVASFAYDEISKLLESSAFYSIRVILLCESLEQYWPTHVYSAMLPINAISIADLLNEAISDYGSQSDVDLFFKIPAVRILAVDDNKSNLMVIEGLLAPYECQIDSVTSGHEALLRVQLYEYDLIFMDHMMPEMDGLETTDRIRQLAKTTKRNHYYTSIPIIALTANAMSGMKEMFLQNGMNDFLAKPIELKHLNMVLTRWIPKEKQLPVTSQDWHIKPSKETIHISGINTQAGIVQTGGTLEGYTRVLRIFEQELEEKVEVMETALKNGDWAAYRICAHSYHGFLATLGAMPLSVTSAMLEDAAQNEDKGTIDTYHSGFIRDLRELAVSVSEKLGTMDEKLNSAVISPADKDYLCAELTRLQSAIKEIKMSLIDSIMNDLLAKQWTKNIAEHLEKIMRCITLFEWQEATELIEQLQKS